jgi:hypothetical protein
MGVDLELIEIFSAQKRTEVVATKTRSYLAFDHALLDIFNLFNRLAQLDDSRSFVAAALHRPLAEALRDAQQPGPYAFFVRRALEAKSFMRAAVQINPQGGEGLWQNLVILFHEAAHALPAEHPIRVELTHAATVLSSSLANDLILGMTGQLLGALDADPIGQGATKDLDRWQATKGDLHISDDAIHETYALVGSDQRFLNELMCDFFALTCIVDLLASRRARYRKDAYADVVAEALGACHKAFLNMRLLQYLTDIARDWTLHIDSPTMNPLKLRLLVEMTFRGNLGVKRLLDSAESFKIPTLNRELIGRLATLQDAHTTNLFEAGGAYPVIACLPRRPRRTYPRGWVRPDRAGR